MRLIYWVNSYDTPKTDTTEIVFGTQYGMQSLKIMQQKRGGKTSIYSGFRKPDWQDLDKIPTAASHGDEDSNRFWRHDYVVKMGGNVATMVQGEIELGIDTEDWKAFFASGRFPRDVGYELIGSIILATDSQEAAHWSMITGLVAPQDTAQEKTIKAAEAKKAKAAADAVKLKIETDMLENARRLAAVEATKVHIARDDSWGVF
jgi:hypothetical protein